MTNTTQNTTRRRKIRPRTWNQGDMVRTRKATIRMTPKLSNRLSSVQGLCHAFGKRETLAELWERVAFPAIERYVRGYADAARKAKGGAR